VKLFASDYDGTFARSNRTPGEIEKNIIQVKQWREAGNLFIFATGRDVPGLLNVLPKHNGLKYDYLVCLNGGTITTHTGEIVLDKVIPQHLANEIMTIVKENNIQEYYIDHVTTNGTGKISVFMDTPDEALCIARLFAMHFEDRTSIFANERCVDLTALGVSKATGVAQVAHRHNIAHKDIYCMGDSHNDIPMLAAYNGITLPGVATAVNAAATQVCGSVGAALELLLAIP